jgi:hypothetical protein
MESILLDLVDAKKNLSSDRADLLVALMMELESAGITDPRRHMGFSLPALFVLADRVRILKDRLPLSQG